MWNKLGGFQYSTIGLVDRSPKRHIDRKRSDEVPSHGLSQDLELLKSNPTRPEQPAFYDDCDMWEDTPKVMKSFLDTEAPEFMTSSRYTSVEFLRGQVRQDERE